MERARRKTGLRRKTGPRHKAGPRLKKRLGQHHLRDGALCQPLVDYLRPAGRKVLEIGPGGGVLTRELLAAGGEVIACEVDLDWAFPLHRQPGCEAVQSVAIDAARLDWRRLPAATLVTGNLPFNVGTPLIEATLRAESVARAAFLVQKEVAERLVAGPGDSAYGALSVLVAARARAVALGVVLPGSFRPPPKVAAAFVGLEMRPTPRPTDEMPAFERLVRLAFAQRRKTIRNSLASGWGRARSEEVLAAAGIDAGRRAQELSLAAFLLLHDAARDAAR